MLSLFGNNTGYTKLNKKWSISNFVSASATSGKNKNITGLAGVSDDLKSDFLRILKEAESKYGRIELDYDKVFRDLATKRKELKMLIEEYKATAKPQDIALLLNTDVQLITNQIRIIESKQKLAESKFKNIREEKKLLTSGNKDSGSSATQQANQQNIYIGDNPIAVAGAAPTSSRTPVTIPLGAMNAFNVEKPQDMIENRTKAFSDIVSEQVTEPEIVEEREVVASPSRPLEGNTNEETVYKSDVVVSRNILGAPTSVSDLQKGSNERILKRLANKENALTTSTVMGNSYNDSLNAIVNSKKDIKEKMYINVNNGHFYIKAFEYDENTKQYDIPVQNHHYKSLVHIGDIKVNPLHKEVVTYYYPEPIPYEIVLDDRDMPEFYANGWEDPKNTKYQLSYDDCQAIIAADEE